MKLWICDSLVEERWETWLRQLPANWSVVPIGKVRQVPAGGEPSLLLIHGNDVWTQDLPPKYPAARVLRYTAAPQRLEINSSAGHLFCSLGLLQERLLQILLTWPVAGAPSKDWLWDMLGANTALEASLELLYRLLPPALDASKVPVGPDSAWETIRGQVESLKTFNDFQAVEQRFEETRALYEKCLSEGGRDVASLRALRDALLGDEASGGLVSFIDQVRRSGGSVGK